MVFYPPKSHPQLQATPEDIPVCEFVFNERYGRSQFKRSRDPYTCGLSGRTFSIQQMKQRSENLSKALLKELGWSVNFGSQWEKVISVFSLNTIDIMTLNWAIQRINGIPSPANAGYTAFELEHQLKNSESKALFTCLPLLSVSLEAASKAGIPRSRIFILDMPKEFLGDAKAPSDLKTVEQLIETGANLPELEALRWEKGQGARQLAFLCYSSGTSGLPKGVMISHRNIISNILAFTCSEQPARDRLGSDHTDVSLCLLPMSHIYGLSVTCHSGTYRGDQLIVLPKFEMTSYLNATTTFKINTLYIVPPIIIAMIKNKQTCDQFDLSSVRVVFTGAAPLGKETADEFQRQYPRIKVLNAYGASEASPMVCGTSELDIWSGSAGSLLPGQEARLVTVEGNEITGYDQPGELWIKGPNVTLGYLKNVAATKETFVEDGRGGRWLCTGDEVVIKRASSGNEHIFIVDRIKELIKVKGLQVAPAELEAHLLTHPAVADCAVIPIPDDNAGELPKAYVVKSQSVGLEENDQMIKRDIQKHVEKDKARHKWLKGGVEFVDVIPKNPSGKILRRMLRDKDKEARKKSSARL